MEQLQRPMIIWGIVAQAGIELTFFASLPFVRNRSYGFFLFTHIVGYIIFPIFVRMPPYSYRLSPDVLQGSQSPRRCAFTRMTRSCTPSSAP